jgi:hypothetical protein
VGGSAGSGAGSTIGVYAGAAYAGMLAAARGMPTSTPATAIFAILLRAADDLARVIDYSLHRVPNITIVIESRIADVSDTSTYRVDATGVHLGLTTLRQSKPHPFHE